MGVTVVAQHRRVTEISQPDKFATRRITENVYESKICKTLRTGRKRSKAFV